MAYGLDGIVHGARQRGVRGGAFGPSGVGGERGAQRPGGEPDRAVLPHGDQCGPFGPCELALRVGAAGPP
ncbi:hypothetical protein GCM10020254_73400 [Streptomyces goshikiensis]